MTAFDTEWNQLKQDAAARSGSGEVRSTRSAWTAAGNEVGLLGAGIAKARGELDKGQESLGAGNDAGVECAVAHAQAQLHRSWHAYLAKVSARCAAITEQLKRAGGELHGDDKAIGRSFEQLRGAYEDTPALGGHDGSR
ncbi:hypothetical protein [Streptomyces sp. NPDC093109]|uniref:hypothetical protein n=1 Tax=Streptomyces sp. NPDC093109 TaxID=3154977 RepID=UPI00344E67B3